MFSSIRNLILWVAFVASAGCVSTADLANSQSSICEIHRRPMGIQVVDCVPGGFSGYRPEYDTARRTQFFHHAGIHFSEDYGYLHASHLRVYVCADCTKAYKEWRAAHPGQ